jgi:hypothetical protein
MSGNDGTQPYTSPYAPPPDNSSSGGTIPLNSAVPDLAMAWQTVPPTTGTQASGSSSDSQPPTSYGSQFTFDFSQLNYALNNILNASNNIVNSYESLKSTFESGKDTVFGQQATISQLEESGQGADYTFWTATYPDPLQSTAQQFADGQNGQPGMNDAQAFALQGIGNAMAALGEFVVLAQSIADGYASADFNSIMPQINES